MRISTHQTPIVLGDEYPTEAYGNTIDPNLFWGNYPRYWCADELLWYYWNGSSWISIGSGNATVTSLNAENGFKAGGDAGIDGTVEMARFGGGKVKLTFKGGIVTEIEDEAE
jgi:hypothetical protein